MSFKFNSFKVSSAKGQLIVVVSEKIQFEKLNKSLKPFIDRDVEAYTKSAKFQGKPNEMLVIPTGKSKVEKVILFGVGKPKDLNEKILKEAGAKIFDLINKKNTSKASILLCDEVSAERNAQMLFGFKIRSYFYNKFITKKLDDFKCHIEQVEVLSSEHKNLEKAFERYANLAQALDLSKDLSNEPPNSLYPETFASKCKDMEKLGVKVEVLTPAEMKKLGMGALLGVAQGSTKEARLVVMKWQGAGKNEQPLAFVGKGVTFDTGGLSLKPAGAMMGMKYDMSGAAVVTGLIKYLALSKTKVNAVGVIGVVENMPDGNAQRPNDIVKSMSGQTIEVLNTDAEGRLVLADALWYTQEKFDPKLMINLATLTGAMIIALADKYAGLFSNNDKISKQLFDAGMEVDEKVWRFPLSPEYDKMMDSKIADMQNIGNTNGAGSIQAAQFLQRFVNKKSWAHIDIAGVDNVKSSSLHQGGSTAFGVQLLAKFIEEHYVQ